MQNIDTQPHILSQLDIQLDFDELAKKIQTSTTRPDLLATARETLHRVNNMWNPAVVYRWLPLEESQAEPEKIALSSDKPVTFDLGYSSIFVKEASYVLVAAYSAGDEIEKEAQKASDNEELLAAYFLDLIGLLVLEKTGNIVMQIAERQAAELGWGVSPFLSPGSVHGWELEDQSKLCSLLPLGEIGVQIQNDTVLTPFKSLSCLIGIGAGYEATQVGTTCQVCSKNDTCQMKQI